MTLRYLGRLSVLLDLRPVVVVIFHQTSGMLIFIMYLMNHWRVVFPILMNIILTLVMFVTVTL